MNSHSDKKKIAATCVQKANKIAATRVDAALVPILQYTVYCNSVLLPPTTYCHRIHKYILYTFIYEWSGAIFVRKGKKKQI